MPSINLQFQLNGEIYKVDLYRTEKEFERYANAVIKQARKILAKEGKNASGNLSKSMYHTFEINKRQFALVFNFDKAPYWQFVEEGVQGAVTNKKAPNSPFKFGSGTGPKGTLRPAIRKWINDKPVKQWRNTKSGRFMSYDQMAQTITRSIYMHGIEPTPFFKPTMTILFKKHQKRIELAYASDVFHFFQKTIPQEIVFEIVL